MSCSITSISAIYLEAQKHVYLFAAYDPAVQLSWTDRITAIAAHKYSLRRHIARGFGNYEADFILPC